MISARSKPTWVLAGMAASALLCACLCATASAGAGECDASVSPAVLDISLYFDYRETDDRLENFWKPQIQELSDRLFTATGGQLCLRNVDAYVRACSESDDADVCLGSLGLGPITNSNMGALGGLGRIYIDEAVTGGAEARPLSLILAHEWGHYQFNLGDEHRGQWVPYAMSRAWDWLDLSGQGLDNGCQEVPQCACGAQGGANHNWSIMSGPRALGDVAGGWPLGFCTSDFHNAGQLDGASRFWLTQQQFRWNMFDGDYEPKDCWTIMRRLTDTSAGQLSVFAATPSYPTALQSAPAINWVVKVPQTRVMLCIDRSGSMSGDKIIYAKLGARMFAAVTRPRLDLSVVEPDLEHEPDWIGVVAFDSTVTTNYPLTEVDAPGSVKAQATTAIAGLAEGGGTAIGDALERCLEEQLSAEALTGNKATGEVVILLSDGGDNSSTIPPLTAAEHCKSNGVSAYTIALGTGADENLMAAIADATGGIYRYAGDAASLIEVFLELMGELRGGLVVSTPVTVLSGSKAIVDVNIDSMSDLVEFVMASDRTDLTVSLVSPSGKTYATSDAGDRVTFENWGELKYFRIIAAAAGKWQVVVDGPDDGKNRDCHVACYATSPIVTVKPDIEQYPTGELHLTCFVAARLPMEGVSVTATVVKPGGAVDTVTLVDTGIDMLGDQEKGDGVYSFLYDGVGVIGTYTVTFRVVNTNGYTIATTSQGVEIPERPVPPFRREVTLSFNATTAMTPRIVDTEWLRVDAWHVRFGILTDFMRIRGEYNTSSSNADPTAKWSLGMIAKAGPVSVGMAPKQFKRDAGGKITYSDKATGSKGVIRVNIGGSTRCKYNLRFDKRHCTSLAGVDPVRIRLETNFSNPSQHATWGFNDFVDVCPVKQGKQGEDGLTFLMPKHFYATQALYADALVAKQVAGKSNANTLRLGLHYESSAGFNPNADTLILDIGGSQLLFYPKGWTKNNGKGKVVYVLNMSAREKWTVKVDTVKRTMSITATKGNFTLSTTPEIRMVYGPVSRRNFDLTIKPGLRRRVQGKNTMLAY